MLQRAVTSTGSLRASFGSNFRTVRSGINEAYSQINTRISINTRRAIQTLKSSASFLLHLRCPVACSHKLAIRAPRFCSSGWALFAASHSQPSDVLKFRLTWPCVAFGEQLVPTTKGAGQWRMLLHGGRLPPDFSLHMIQA